MLRHPGYAGNILPLLGIVLALGSLWTLIPAPVALIIAVIRTALEERTLPSVNQLRSLHLKRVLLHASFYSGRRTLRFPPACHSSPLAPILSMLLPPNSAICVLSYLPKATLQVYNYGSDRCGG